MIYKYSVLLIVLASVQVSAQTALKYSNDFLSIGVGARAAGMSNAVLAVTDDVTAGFWNPAALLRLKDKAQIAYMHNNYFGGIGNFDYGALGFRITEDQAAAFSFVRLGIDGIPNTLDLMNNGQIDYDRIRAFSAVDYAFLFSYAKSGLIEGLNLGGNAKIIHRKAGEFAKAWGFGVDLSGQYVLENGWKFAAVAKDITTTFNAWSYDFTMSEKEVFEQTGNEIPENSLELTLPRLLLGAGKYFQLKEKVGVYTELDADITSDGKRNTLLRSGLFSVDPYLGLEANYARMIYLRLGAGNFQRVENFSGSTAWTWQPNFGVGLSMHRFALDYALTDVGNQSDVLYSHVFSVRFNIVD